MQFRGTEHPIDQVDQDGSGRAKLIFTFCPIFEVSEIMPDGGSTGRATWTAAAFAIFLNIIRDPIIFIPFDWCCQDCLATLPYQLRVAPPFILSNFYVFFIA